MHKKLKKIPGMEQKTCGKEHSPYPRPEMGHANSVDYRSVSTVAQKNAQCAAAAPVLGSFMSAWVHTGGGGGGFRPGTISQGIISPGEIFATVEIPKAPSKHVSCKMSLNFRKMT